MQNQIIKIGLFVSFIFMLILLCYLYINFASSDNSVAESQKDDPVFEPKTPRYSSNPDLNFVNSMGSDGNETLLAVHPLSSVYLVLFRASSTSGDFRHLKTNGLLIAKMSKSGIINDIKNLGDYTYSDSVVYQGKVAVAATSASDGALLLLIDTNLNISTNPVPYAKLLAAEEKLYLFDNNSLNTFPAVVSQTFEGSIIDIFESGNNIIFFTKQNNNIFKYTLSNGLLSLDLQFVDASVVKIAMDGEILVTRDGNDLIITKISGSDIIFSTAIQSNSNNIEILLHNTGYSTGYSVLIKDTTNSLYYICEHGDIISKKETAITATVYNDYFISLSSAVSVLVLGDLNTLVSVSSIFGDTLPQKIIFINNLIFIETGSNTLDFTGSWGERDIFIFSLKLQS